MAQTFEEAFAEEWGFREKTRPLAERDWIYGWFRRGWNAAQDHEIQRSE